MTKPFKAAIDRFDESVREFYEHGLLQFGTMTYTHHRGLDYRSIYAQAVGRDRFVFGEAELDLKVYGLSGKRMELFGEIASFVEGLAAEQMYHRGLAFAKGTSETATGDELREIVKHWEAEGFRLRRAKR